jgi:Bifunctional DNA primase/polymerase, N-terminal
VITNEEPAVDEPVKPTAIDAPLAATSLPPDDEEKLSADALALGVYVANLPADELAEYMSAIAGLVERELPPGQPAPVARLEIVEESPPLIEQEPPAASGATSAVYVEEVESPTPAAVEESTPRLQRDTTNCAVTPEDRLIGLIIKYRVSAADVPLAKEHLHDFDLQYVWQRWTRLGREVDQLDVEAIRARPDRWARFTVWLIDEAAAPEQHNPIDPIREIATLAEQIRGRIEEPPPTLAATDVVEILPPVPPSAPLEIVEEGPPSLNRPLIEIEQPPPEHPAPAAPAEIEAQASLPLDRASPADIEPRNLTAALDLAGAGFAVFLCDQHKKPRGKWRDISTTDPETIRLRFQRWPDSIVGIDLAKSGLIVVDADRHDPEHDGVDALARLESENEPFENHPIIRTPRNGFHHVFRQPPGIPLGNATGALPKGIDIRAAGGFVIACGSISTVFGEWVAADRSPSLIEAFLAGTIPVLPDWLATIIQTRTSNNVVPSKPREPKEGVPKEPEAAPRPASSPTSRQKKRAAVALQGNAAEIAATQPGNRNNRLNALSYRSGRMVAPGSITRQQVIDAFIPACKANGLVRDDGIDSVMRTIKSGLDAGMKKPLEDVAVRSSEKRQGRNPYEREVQRSEVMALFRLRFGPHASYEAVDDVLAKIDSDDKRLIGRELAFTFEENKRMGIEPLGRRRAKHPSTIRPFNATEAWIQAHLKEFKKSRNAVAHKDQRTKLAEARKAVEDLDDRSSAVLTFLQHSAGPQTIAQIAAGIRKSRAFADLTDNALRRTILRLVKPPSKLSERVVLIEGKNKTARKHSLWSCANEPGPLRQKPVRLPGTRRGFHCDKTASDFQGRIATENRPTSGNKALRHCDKPSDFRGQHLATP